MMVSCFVRKVDVFFFDGEWFRGGVAGRGGTEWGFRFRGCSSG